MTQITRTVTAADLRPLLEGATSATVAWVQEGQLMAAEAAFSFRDEEYRFALAEGMPAEGTEVSLLIDSGVQYFELRGVRVRGPARQIEAPLNASTGLDWFAVDLEREVAWHYGTLRENERSPG